MSSLMSPSSTSSHEDQSGNDTTTIADSSSSSGKVSNGSLLQIALLLGFISLFTIVKYVCFRRRRRHHEVMILRNRNPTGPPVPVTTFTHYQTPEELKERSEYVKLRLPKIQWTSSLPPMSPSSLTATTTPSSPSNNISVRTEVDEDEAGGGQQQKHPKQQQLSQQHRMMNDRENCDDDDDESKLTIQSGGGDDHEDTGKSCNGLGKETQSTRNDSKNDASDTTTTTTTTNYSTSSAVVMEKESLVDSLNCCPICLIEFETSDHRDEKDNKTTTTTTTPGGQPAPATTTETIPPSIYVSKSSNPNCVHVYHYSCIYEWLLKHDDCPICRLEFLPKSQSPSPVRLPSPDPATSTNSASTHLNDDAIVVDVEEG